MSWFETHLKRGAEERALVRIDDQRVTVTIGDALPASRAYNVPEQAWCVYEWHRGTTWNWRDEL